MSVYFKYNLVEFNAFFQQVDYYDFVHSLAEITGFTFIFCCIWLQLKHERCFVFVLDKMFSIHPFGSHKSTNLDYIISEVNFVIFLCCQFDFPKKKTNYVTIKKNKNTKM